MDLRGEALVEAGCRLFNHPPSLQGIRLHLDPPDSCLHPQEQICSHIISQKNWIFQFNKINDNNNPQMLSEDSYIC